MIDRDLFDSYDTALNALDDLTRRAVEYMVKRYEGYPDDMLQNALEANLPATVQFFGREAAYAALDFYRKERASLQDAGDFTPKPAEVIQESWIHEDVAKAMEPQHKGTSDRTGLANNLAGKMMRRVRDRADRTITLNSERDPLKPRWAIVPHAGACPWCIMYASWGFHYASESSAKSQRHANCKCVVVKDSDTENPVLEGYDPDGMRERLLRCGEDAGTGVDNWEASLEAASKFYDREWLRTGAIPTVSYDSEETRKKKQKQDDHKNEFRTTTILASRGFSCIYLDDSGGLTDLANGIEIKTLDAASTFNTFSSQISNGVKKEGLSRLVIDISENPYVSDKQAKEWIEQRISRYPWVRAVDMIGHGRQLEVVKNPKAKT